MRYQGTAALLLTIFLLVLSGCPVSREAETNQQSAKPTERDSQGQLAEAPGAVRILADPALRLMLEGLQSQFELIHTDGYVVSFADRGEMNELARRSNLSADDLPDIFLTGDKPTQTALYETELLDLSTSRTFAGDMLVFASRAGEKWKPLSVFDVHKLRFNAMGIGSERTIAGYYGNQAILTSGAMDRLEDRIVKFDSSSAVAKALTDKSVDLAILMVSTAATVPDIQTVYLIEETYHEDIQFKAAAASERIGKQGVQEFLKFIAEDEAIQQQITGYGFVDRRTAMEETK